MKRFFRCSAILFAALALPTQINAASTRTTMQTLAIDRPTVITAMTFNVRVETLIDGPNRWDKRKTYVYDLIADHVPDVVGLQEAKASQYKEIRKALPAYQGYAVGRSNGKTKGETCAILYRDSRLLKTDAGTFWFSDTPDKPGSKDWGNMPPRICSWVRLVDKTTLSAFYVYNVHMDHLSQNSREKSVQLLTERIAARKTADPYIVMGDFNMKMNNSAMEYLMTNTEAPMADAWTSLNGGIRNMGTRHGFNGNSGPQIDHIPLSRELKALSIVIDNRKYNGRYPSDHSPVIAKVLVPPRTYAKAAPLYSKEAPRTMF
jgi:endonuclease/exonuclease/phosphatase family metal-dependent hydrolase